ncbi:MAG: Fatty acyl-CoA reductase, partial [Actinomycetota bacterium]
RSRLEHWSPHRGDGRRVLVTGANSGLGLATTRALLAAGAEVVAVVRDADKGRALAAAVAVEPGEAVLPRLTIESADLAVLGTVRSLADRLHDGGGVDVVVHNAGAMEPERIETPDGHERTYQVHVLAPFLLTSRLLPDLARRKDARVVTVTSGGMYATRLEVDRIESPDDFTPTLAYARAKRAQVALTQEWDRRFGGHGIGFHCVHPGWAATPGLERSLPGFHRLMGPLLRDADEGADTIVHLALAPRELLPTGRLWHDRRVRTAHRVPWTVTGDGSTQALWRRLVADAGQDPSTAPLRSTRDAGGSDAGSTRTPSRPTHEEPVT